MALFANITAADLKKGDIIMFAMGSSSPSRVPPRANRCLGGQFACALMYYAMISTIVNVTNGSWGVFVGCILVTRNDFM
jgi:hypothetical protein